MRLAPRPQRHGVLLLVVLSVLVLFMLIGTAFMMTSSQYRTAAVGAAKAGRTVTPPDDLLTRGLMQVVRDTNNQFSAVHYHSLLRDLYGTDGFEAEVYSPLTMDLTTPAGQVSRFAGAIAGTEANQLGPTEGQFIDIYVRELAYKADDPLTPDSEIAATSKSYLLAPDARHVLKLERDVNGQPEMLSLPLTKGYFNGCLLTITSGPASGRSARIVDYECVAPSITPTATSTQLAAPFPLKPNTRLFRFRVMAFPRADGQPLQVSTTRPPELEDLAGATLVVNGRPYSGTGVGYNPMATVGSPRLNAVERLLGGTTGAEVALLPNATYFDWTNVASFNIADTDPFLTGGTADDFTLLNAGTVLGYPSFVGAGDANESYDAADFQNMFLALQTVSPRSRGRVKTDERVEPYEIDDNIQGDFERLDLEDLPLPSFHRPALVNFWYHRMLMAISDGDPNDDQVRAILEPYGPDAIRDGAPGDHNDNPTGVAVATRDQIVAMKRKISLRPLREDNPNFDGSNPQSRPADLSETNGLVTDNGNIAVPYWEAVGPWDVDNDNDGVPDSVWVDLGEPVQAAEDGTLYKPLFAFLIVDLDSRLNVNAHGLVDDITPAHLASDPDTGFDRKNMAGGATSNVLPQGLGYGPADISLRPVFPVPWTDESGTTFAGNRLEDYNGDGLQDLDDVPVDDYAAILAGRIKLGDYSGNNRPLVTGRHGIDPVWGNDFNVSIAYPFDAAPGITSSAVVPNMDQIGPPDLLTQFAFFGHPQFVSNYLPANIVASSFSTPPDLMGRYSLGLDYTGQPVNELTAEPIDRPLVADSPYELDLSGDRRRDTRADGQILRITMSTPTTGTTDYFEATPSPTLQNRVPGVAADTDDAAFATADLERVLRAYDADAGTLPSRLWDVVAAFDPLKLCHYNPNGSLASSDPYRLAWVAQDRFNNTNITAQNANYATELLAAAQQLSGENRRLVTTDSYDLPVPGDNWTKRLQFGADGQPGIAGVDDDSNGLVDDSYLESKAYGYSSFSLSNPDANSNFAKIDDYHAVMGVDPPANAGLLDYLRYRIILQFEKEGIITAGLVPNNPILEARISAIINGGTWTDGGGTVHQEGGLLAPEVIAGKRMDLNRPFGDGHDGDWLDNDNNGLVDDDLQRETDRTLSYPDRVLNGVVDEPLEAGEPFLDRMNAMGQPTPDGKWENGEPYIDVDGDGAYTPPRDQLWQGLTTEQISFDYTGGHGEPIHPAVATAVGANGTVRNLESQGRQLYARQLYCLMLLLMDENYIAPWDENDPQIATWLDHTIANSLAANVRAAVATATNPDQEARRIMLRKLTCRTIAQWAVNCADFRDADAIMTPFEYDENPWDGWGCPDGDGVNLPLDGDPATDENKGDVIDWSQASAGSKVVLSGKPATGGLVTPPTALNQTRGVVWGVERPELLITETLAMHDRRTEDLQSPDESHHDYVQPHSSSGSKRPGPDLDLDQRLRPRGSLFVELYNPWSDDGKPAELYSLINSETGRADVDRNRDGAVDSRDLMGVELGRLSNAAVDTKGTPSLADDTISAAPSTPAVRRSPVWRLVVVEEWPNYRNTDPADDQKYRPDVDLPTGVKEPDAYTKAANYVMQEWGNAAATSDPPVRPTNPDFDAAFDAGFKITWKKRTKATDPTTGNNYQRNVFNVKYPYIEREFYFTSDNSPRTGLKDTRSVTAVTQSEQVVDVTSGSFRLRVPNRSISYAPTDASGDFVRQAQKFIAKQTPIPGTDPTDVPIAPILPGRYGVVGSAGTKYEAAKVPATMANSYTTLIGRNTVSGGSTETTEAQNYPQRTRRIELRPQTDPSDPTVSRPDRQQVLVACNGGEPSFTAPTKLNEQFTNAIARDNELIQDLTATHGVQNLYDSNDDGTLDADYYQPAVAIPVDGMNISEPPWGWLAREYELTAAEFGATSSGPQYHFAPRLADREGVYTTKDPGGATANDQASWDRPFDDALELVRTGTTPNYRTIHLQRLANPLLPWNPPRLMADDNPDPDHNPNLPVNPYRTVDTSGVDLTAFNGTSSSERKLANSPLEFARKKYEAERKYRPWAPISGGGTSERQQFDANMKDPNGAKQLWQLQSMERGSWTLLQTLGYAASAAVPPARVLWAQEPALPNLLRQKGQLWLIDYRKTTLSREEVPEAVRQAENVRENHMDMVIEHSLGFGNEPFGTLYTANSTPVQQADDQTRPRMIGAPAPFESPTKSGEKPVNSTYPWLAWDNRPFVSAGEIMQIPAASSAQLLRQFSTINSNLSQDKQPNPYDGDGLIDDTESTTLNNLEDQDTTNHLTRLRKFLSPFGQLLNPFLTAIWPAGPAVDATGNPIVDAKGNWQFIGAPHFYRILDYVQVPSRYVGTDTMFDPAVFNDVASYISTTEPVGTDITGPADPRYSFQPPFNKVSRERDPGRVNLNTVIGRRETDPYGVEPPHIWSEVYDGIMHRYQDGNPAPQLSQFGPAWRDVTLSRRGYTQRDAAWAIVDKPAAYPDTLTFGLNPSFPTFFANPFRSPDAGDLVPLAQMLQYGVDASWLRVHPYRRGNDRQWGPAPAHWVNGQWQPGPYADARDAGFGNNMLSTRGVGAIPSLSFSTKSLRDIMPLFSELRSDPSIDTTRNAGMMYQPMTRLGNLVTTRSGVFAIWVTVGYFEVEPAPDWNLPEVRQRFGGTTNDTDATTIAARALYDRVYPEGYMLGREMGIDTGDAKRQRGFYIVDRTQPVGFKPGEDLNVEDMIRVRRRIE